MRPTRSAPVAELIFALVFSACDATPSSAPPVKTTSSASTSAAVDEAPLTVAALKSMRPGSKVYAVDAWVVVADVPTCPECPDGTQCPACKHRVIISDDDASPTADAALGDDDIPVSGDRDQVAPLRLGARYRFHVRLWRMSKMMPLMAKVIDFTPL